MKKILLAMGLGLLVGWVIPHLFREEEDVVEVPTKSATSLRKQDSVSRFGPSSPFAKSGLSLDEQRRGRREKGSNTPYRSKLFSMDLVSSLSVEELVAALRAGQIRDETEVSQAFSEIAKSDPILPLELLREIPARSQKDRAQSAILKACVENAPASFFDHLKSLPATEHRLYLIEEFVSLWAKKDPALVLSQIQELKEIAHPRTQLLTQSLVSDWAKRDFEAAEEWVESTTEGKEKRILSEKLLIGQLDSLSGEEAVSFILSHPESKILQRRLGMTLKNATFGDPEGAVKQFVQLPEGHQVWSEVADFGQSVSGGLLLRNRDLDEILKWVDYFPDEKDKRQFLLGAAKGAMWNDIEAGERLFTALPESRERDEAAKDFVEYKMRQDPVALAQWLSELEPATTRDGAVSRFASLLKESDPERAREWADTIVDENERNQTLTVLSE